MEGGCSMNPLHSTEFRGTLSKKPLATEKAVVVQYCSKNLHSIVVLTVQV
jgi:hypothetical protein